MGTRFDQRRFIPHYQLHEFEALLFADPQLMEAVIGIDRKLKSGCFQAIRDQFNSPEDINEIRTKSPAKRIEAMVQGQKKYSKPVEGILILSEISLHQIRSECPHFDSWLMQLEQLGSSSE
jgi:Domain of unknown function (DUF4276)